MMEASGRKHVDYSADYRVFARGAWHARDIFRSLLDPIVALDPVPDEPVVASLDDTHVKKSGTKIPGVSYVRDPMSPKFRPNFIRAQRFVQANVAIPFGPGPSACRAFPVAFEHAPAAKKLSPKASEEDKKLFRQEQKQKRLSRYGVATITRLRSDLDQIGNAERDLLVAVDSSYTCQDVLKNLPERTDLIGRIRKDAVLHQLPAAKQSSRGRKRWYGDRAPTPDQLRQDDSIPWQTVTVFAAGRIHSCQVKQLQPVQWRKAGADRHLRLIVIHPLGYRLRKKGRILYRDPAYLITTDFTRSLEQILQAYFRRWEIEVNHRDEKQLMGLGHAQVRSPLSVERVPAFIVACYSILLLAAAHAYGLAAAQPLTPPPSWYPQAATQVRLPTQQILGVLRNDLVSTAIIALPNFSDFPNRVERFAKCQKGTLSTDEAIHFAMN
jgi:DDE superfamily endonuclease